MSAHSSLGPSAAEQWWNCPGSIREGAKCPPLPSNKHAAAGTVAHGLGEAMLKGELTSEQLFKKIDEVVIEDGFEITIDEEMCNSVIEYHDTVRDDLKKLRASPKTAPVVAKIEERVCASSVDKELWGTADHMAYRKGDTLLIHDFKNGKGLVEVDENKQLGIYAVAAQDTEAGAAFDKVELVVVQPRARHEDGIVRRWTASKLWLEEFRKDLAAAVARTKDPNAPLKAGKWCHWCRASPTCPVVRGEVQSVARVDFESVAPVTVKGTPLPSVEHLPMAKLVEALRHEDMVNKWFEAIRLRLRTALETGHEVEGVKLVEGRANRRFISEEAVIKEYAGIIGEEALYNRKFKSPAQLETIVGKGKIPEHLVEKPAGKKTIALDADPRPRTVSSAQEDFADKKVPQITADDVFGLTRGPMDPGGPQEPKSKIVNVSSSIDIKPMTEPDPFDFVPPVPVSDLAAELLGLPAEEKKKEPMWP